MNAILLKYNISAVWHFTDQSNLEMIKQHGGLMSLTMAKEKGVEIPTPGGNEWSHDADKRKGLDKYVHLSFLDEHPMLYLAKEEKRIIKAVWLKIHPSILLIEGVRCTADVSNKSGVSILNCEEALDKIDFEVLFEWTDWKDPKIQERRRAARKSEILIPDFIPIQYIKDCKNG